MFNQPIRTEIQIQKAEYSLTHQQSVMLIGSCFAENIGEKLDKYKFSTCINPFGILFNPVSIAQSLDLLTDNVLFQEDKLHFFNEEWISFFHHGRFSHANKQNCLDGINQALSIGRTFLQEADFLILTFGSSISYSYKGRVVANCHRIPQKEFQKQMIGIQDIVFSLTRSIEKIKSINPNIRILFTVSPVRYIKHNLMENTLSKAQLIVAAHELVRQLENSDYFPAYEIMMDDLRDYRFYSEDMAHPTSLAINYLWNAFSRMFFDKETMQLNALIDEIIFAKSHRLKHPFSAESMRFKEEQLKKIQVIQSRYPQLPFEDEINYFSK